MKRLVLVGALVGALGAGAYAQGAAAAGAQDTGKTARKGGQAANSGAGHTAPKSQPDTEPAPSVPDNTVQLGTVHIPKGVKANGQPLPAGTYTLRVTSETAGGQDAKGQTKSLERWAEFMKGGKAVGREVMSIVPQSDIKMVEKDTPPKPGSSKVETLKGGDYLRIWFNKGGTHYLMYLPV